MHCLLQGKGQLTRSSCCRKPQIIAASRKRLSSEWSRPYFRSSTRSLEIITKVTTKGVVPDRYSGAVFDQQSKSVVSSLFRKSQMIFACLEKFILETNPSRAQGVEWAAAL